ncbi:hypothetical protein COOONC_17990 [Cooperia oncophora]
MGLTMFVQVFTLAQIHCECITHLSKVEVYSSAVPSESYQFCVFCEKHDEFNLCVHLKKHHEKFKEDEVEVAMRMSRGILERTKRASVDFSPGTRTFNRQRMGCVQIYPATSKRWRCSSLWGSAS